MDQLDETQRRRRILARGDRAPEREPGLHVFGELDCLARPVTDVLTLTGVHRRVRKLASGLQDTTDMFAKVPCR